MQSGYLVITFGFQFFLLLGHLFYFLFRKCKAIDDQIVLLFWVIGFLGLLTIGLLVTDAIILLRMVIKEAIEHGFLDEET